MEPAVHCLAILDSLPDSFWSRLLAALDAQGSPPIYVRQEGQTAVFTARTGAFMLRARVADGIASVLDHDGWQRAFAPMD